MDSIFLNLHITDSLSVVFALTRLYRPLVYAPSIQIAPLPSVSYLADNLKLDYFFLLVGDLLLSRYLKCSFLILRVQ